MLVASILRTRPKWVVSFTGTEYFSPPGKVSPEPIEKTAVWAPARWCRECGCITACSSYLGDPAAARPGARATKACHKETNEPLHSVRETTPRSICPRVSGCSNQSTNILKHDSGNCLQTSCSSQYDCNEASSPDPT
jgi:hypothetical protein